MLAPISFCTKLNFMESQKMALPNYFYPDYFIWKTKAARSRPLILSESTRQQYPLC